MPVSILSKIRVGSCSLPATSDLMLSINRLNSPPLATLERFEPIGLIGIKQKNGYHPSLKNLKQISQHLSSGGHWAYQPVSVIDRPYLPMYPFPYAWLF